VGIAIRDDDPLAEERVLEQRHVGPFLSSALNQLSYSLSYLWSPKPTILDDVPQPFSIARVLKCPARVNDAIADGECG